MKIFIIVIVVIILSFIIYKLLFNNKVINIIKIDYNNLNEIRLDCENKLKAMSSSNLDDHFVIMNINKFYIQFVQWKNNNEIYCESVGGIYLKDIVDNPNIYNKNFEKLGFDITNENYTKIYYLDKMSYEDIINEAFYIFRNIYNLPNGADYYLDYNL